MFPEASLLALRVLEADLCSESVARDVRLPCDVFPQRKDELWGHTPRRLLLWDWQVNFRSPSCPPRRPPESLCSLRVTQGGLCPRPSCRPRVWVGVGVQQDLDPQGGTPSIPPLLWGQQWVDRHSGHLLTAAGPLSVTSLTLCLTSHSALFPPFLGSPSAFTKSQISSKPIGNPLGLPVPTLRRDFRGFW